MKVPNRYWATLPILIVVAWLSLTPYLFPLPPERIAELSGPTGTEDLAWLSKSERDALTVRLDSYRNAIWRQWLGSAFAIVCGAIFGTLLRKDFPVAYLIVWVLSGLYIFYWGSQFHSAERTAIELFLARWEAVKFLDSPIQYSFFIYYQMILPAFHAFVICALAFNLFGRFKAMAEDK